MKPLAFSFTEATHGAILSLRNGAELTVMKTPTTWLIRGDRAGVSKQICLSNDAVEALLGVLLANRSTTGPIEYNPLFPVDK